MKKTGISIATILMMTVLVVTGCGTKTAAAPANNVTTPAQTQAVSDREKAAAVARDVVDAFCSFTYKDRSSFDAPGKFMFPDLAAKENAHDEKDMAEYVKDQSYEIHGPITVNFVKQTGNSFVFTVDTKVTVVQDKTQKQLAQFDAPYTITVTKTTDGKFLVSEVQLGK